MNQILVTERIYVTPKLKRKKKIYKFLFVASIISFVILSGKYLYDDYTERREVAQSEEILIKMESCDRDDETVADVNTLLVALNEYNQDIEKVEKVEKVEDAKEEEPKTLEKFDIEYTTDKGTKYKIDSILNIPSLGIYYPVISETTDELLKISLNKFWGGEPNSVGNYCIVGHNYDGKDILFGKLNKIQIGDIVELEDKTGKLLKYKVYNTYIVKPTDVACTSQITNGRREMTLITCADGGKTRLIVKCRAVE